MLVLDSGPDTLSSDGAYICSVKSIIGYRGGMKSFLLLSTNPELDLTHRCDDDPYLQIPYRQLLRAHSYWLGNSPAVVRVPTFGFRGGRGICFECPQIPVGGAKPLAETLEACSLRRPRWAGGRVQATSLLSLSSLVRSLHIPTNHEWVGGNRAQTWRRLPGFSQVLA